MKSIKFFALFFLGLLVAGSIYVKWLYPESMWNTEIALSLQGPNFNHWFGMDSLGRDLLLRCLQGARGTLILGVLCSAFSLMIGLVFGAWSGWKGGWWDIIMMRILEILMSLPNLVTTSLLVLLVVSTNDQDQSLWSLGKLSIAISLGSWMGFARLVRNLVQQEKSQTYVKAAITLGASDLRILIKEIWPQLRSPVAVFFALQIPHFLLYEGVLSFLGLGVKPPNASWGLLLQEGWRLMLVEPHVLLGPALILFFTVFALQLLFEDLRLRMALNSHIALKEFN